MTTSPDLSPFDEPQHEKMSTAPSRGGKTGQADASRADLVLLFGILSLFLCGPLGIIAWIMGSSDLHKIRSGILPRVKVGSLKVGRALGIVGTALFAVALVLGVIVVKQYANWGPRVIDGFFHPDHLPLAHIAFAGEWYGTRGTVITIRPDGSGDFRSRHTSVTGGRVNISDDSLSIGLLGLAKTWRIDKRPYVKDGMWIMKLDGEEFARKAEGLLVRRFCVPVGERCCTSHKSTGSAYLTVHAGVSGAPFPVRSTREDGIAEPFSLVHSASFMSNLQTLASAERTYLWKVIT